MQQEFVEPPMEFALKNFTVEIALSSYGSLALLLFCVAIAATNSSTLGVTAPSPVAGGEIPAGELNDQPDDGTEPLEPAYVVCFEFDDVEEIVGGCPGLEFSNPYYLRVSAFDGVPFFIESDRGLERLIIRGTVRRLNDKDEKYRMELVYFMGKFTEDRQHYSRSHKSSTSFHLKFDQRFQFGRGRIEREIGETAKYITRCNYSTWIEKYDTEKLEQRTKPPPRKPRLPGVPDIMARVDAFDE